MMSAFARGEGWAIYHGTAPAILPLLPSRSVDMVYLDPPFGTGQVRTEKSGSFDDRWQWTAETNAAATRLAAIGEGQLLNILQHFPRDRNDRAYLVFMADLLAQIGHALKLTGTVWLHCDDHFSHYLKVIADLLFLGRGEVIWRRANAHNARASKSFARVHDTILVFARSRAADLRLARIRRRFRDEEISVDGDPLEEPLLIAGFIESERMGATDKERLGYPTQKPRRLLERLISIATLRGDAVLDPCCGSGTTLDAARQLGRRALGIDQSSDAVALAAKRLTPPQTDLFGFAA